MSQNELKNAGYAIVQKAAIAKGFDEARTLRLIESYVDSINAHDEVNAILVQLLALCAIENA